MVPHRPSRDRAAPARADVPLGLALRDPTFRWLVVAFCLSNGVAFGVHVHPVPILLDRGYVPTLAATQSGLVGAMQVLGRLLLGPVAGRLPLKATTIGIFVVLPVALLVLLLVPGTAGVVLFVALFGAAKGCLTLVRPAFVAELYGRTHYASIAGVVAFAATLAQAAAPVGAGGAYDAVGGYGPILWTLVSVSALAALALLPTRPEPDGIAWKTGPAGTTTPGGQSPGTAI